MARQDIDMPMNFEGDSEIDRQYIPQHPHGVSATIYDSAEDGMKWAASAGNGYSKYDAGLKANLHHKQEYRPVKKLSTDELKKIYG